MLNAFKNEITRLIKERYNSSFFIKEDEWDEVIQQVREHLFSNYILMGKDITFEDFVENIWFYVKIKRDRIEKGSKDIETKWDTTGE